MQYAWSSRMETLKRRRFSPAQAPSQRKVFTGNPLLARDYFCPSYSVKSRSAQSDTHPHSVTVTACDGLKIICRWPRSGAAQILREFDRAISFGGLSPLRSGQQSSCACDCRNGNGDDEKLERSGERTIFELVDSRKQRESDEADGEYVEGGPHLGCSVPDCRGVATASSVSGGLALTRIYRSTGPLRFRTMECDGAPVVAFLRLGKPHGTPPPTRLLPLGLG